MPPKYWRTKHGKNAYQAPPPPLFRRILRLIFNPLTIGIFLFAVLGVFLTLTYFWFEYSEKVDLLLGRGFYKHGGRLFSTENSKKGEGLSAEDLVSYLKTAGYIEKNDQADPSRSRYQIKENEIEIEPGNTAMIDGTKTFSDLTVKFKKDGKSVASITDKNAEKPVESAKLEPKILSSIAAEGDGRRKAVKFNDLPNALVKAITATEDRAFFEHYGVNFRGIARAAYRRYEKEDDNSPLANQGGSSYYPTARQKSSANTRPDARTQSSKKRICPSFSKRVCRKKRFLRSTPTRFISDSRRAAFRSTASAKRRTSISARTFRS